MAIHESNQIFANLALKIRQSLELDDILETSVAEVRQLLDCDRVLIYRFYPDWSGVVAVESVARADWSIRSWVIRDPCFERSWLTPYREGRVQATADVHQAGLRDCYIEFLATYQVRANLVVPILLSDRPEPLWGLLIAHHCTAPRDWPEADCQLLKQLADQMAIAIQQALLLQRTQAELAERRHAEASLEASEARFRRLAEQAQDVIYRYVWQPAPQVEYINPAITALTGYTPGEFYASSDLLFALVHHEDRKQFRQQLSPPDNDAIVDADDSDDLGDAGDSSAPGDSESQSRLTVLRCLHRDGHVVWVEQRCTFLRDEAGNLVAVEGIVRDIGDRPGDLSLSNRSLFLGSWLFQASLASDGQEASFWGKVWQGLRGPLSHLALSRWASATVMLGMIVLAEGLRRGGLSAASQMLVLFVGLVLAANGGGLKAGLLATLTLWCYLLATFGLEDEVARADWPLYLAIYAAATAVVAVSVGQTKDRSLLADQALNQVNETLEQRVQERTATLDRTNRQLREEIDERRRAQAAHQAAEVEFQQLNQVLESRVLERTATLAASEARWRNFIDTVRLLVVDIGVDGRVNYVNPHFLALTGYEAEAVIGCNWFDTFVPRHRLSQTQELFQEFLDKGFHSYFQTVILTSSGEEMVVAWNNTLLRDGADQVQGSLSIGEDITERYAIARMKDEFISVVSHELRTPLTSIHGALELLDSAVVPLESERGRHVLAIAAENSQRLVRLVNDILQLERLESGKINLERRLLCSRDVTARAHELMQMTLERSHIELVLEDPGVELWADSDRIIQVLTNLLDNAIKFSEADGRVSLVVEAAASPTVPGQTMVLFKVSDEGRGIPLDMLGSIFERFHQVDASDSRRRGGTGLGLAICRSIVQQHGGQIWVQSSPGQGSHFYFVLPSKPDNPGGLLRN